VTWALCSAQLRCARRRASAAFAASPVLVGAGVLGVALLPAVALWFGTRLGPTLRDAAAEDARLARSMGLSACLAAALAGVVLALIAPGVRALGAQLAAAPVSRLTTLLGLTFVPFVFAVTFLALPAVLFLAPVTRSATPAACASLGASLGLGAAVAEAALALARRAARGLAVAGAAAALAVLDPARGLADAFLGHRALSRPALLALAALVLWFAAAATRPAEPARRGAARFVARGPFAVAIARYARAPELRRQAVASVALAGGGAALLRALGSTHEVASLFAAATGVFGAALVPLAAPGLDRLAGWVWRSAPRSQSGLALCHAAAALTAGAFVGSAAVLAALAASPIAPGNLAPLAPLGALLFGAALVAGAAVPWHAERATEQFASYAAFAAVAVLLSGGLARLAPIVGARSGAPAAALAAVTALGCVLASAAISGRRA
jgi:hypothetical protein